MYVSVHFNAFGWLWKASKSHGIHTWELLKIMFFGSSSIAAIGSISLKATHSVRTKRVIVLLCLVLSIRPTWSQLDLQLTIRCDTHVFDNVKG